MTSKQIEQALTLLAVIVAIGLASLLARAFGTLPSSSSAHYLIEADQ